MWVELSWRRWNSISVQIAISFRRMGSVAENAPRPCGKRRTASGKQPAGSSQQQTASSKRQTASGVLTENYNNSLPSGALAEETLSQFLIRSQTVRGATYGRCFRHQRFCPVRMFCLVPSLSRCLAFSLRNCRTQTRKVKALLNLHSWACLLAGYTSVTKLSTFIYRHI